MKRRKALAASRVHLATGVRVQAPGSSVLDALPWIMLATAALFSIVAIAAGILLVLAFASRAIGLGGCDCLLSNAVGSDVHLLATACYGFAMLPLVCHPDFKPVRPLVLGLAATGYIGFTVVVLGGRFLSGF